MSEGAFKKLCVARVQSTFDFLAEENGTISVKKFSQTVFVENDVTDPESWVEEVLLKLNGNPDVGFRLEDFLLFCVEYSRDVEADFLRVVGDLWLETVRREMAECTDQHAYLTPLHFSTTNRACSASRTDWTCFATADSIFHHGAENVQQVIHPNQEREAYFFHAMDEIHEAMKHKTKTFNGLWRARTVGHGFVLRLNSNLEIQLLHSWEYKFSLNWWLGVDTDEEPGSLFTKFRDELGRQQWIPMETFWKRFKFYSGLLSPMGALETLDYAQEKVGVCPLAM